MSVPFDWGRLDVEDQALAREYIGPLRDADYAFFPPNELYQYRWYIVPRKAAETPGVFLHIMTGDDPTDELHDHDWHNTTHVLAGSAVETYNDRPYAKWHLPYTRILKPGDVIYRDAREAHRFDLGMSPYLMTLFAIGPRIRKNKRWKLK